MKRFREFRDRVRRTIPPFTTFTALATLSTLACVSASGATSFAATEERCTAVEREAALRRLQSKVLAAVPREVASLDEAVRPGGPLDGWRLSHGLVVLAGAGAVGVDNIRAKDPLPQLLLYEPSPESSPDDWLDFDEPDGPYRLVGWAYIGPYTERSTPPKKPCIEASEWFVHEAGWHMKDGGMRLTPGATVEPPRPAEPVHFWHPRAWDLHVWLDPDGVPSTAFANPRAREGGVVLPKGAFLEVVNTETGKLRPLS